MTITRQGKIARLPRALRNELNRRLDDGEPGRRLIAWLNALPAVQAIMAAQFAGKPIREQNLSEWRQGGYRDWVLQQETLEVAERLREEAQTLTEPDGENEQEHPALSDTLALWLTARYAVATRRVAEADEAEGWKLLREMCHDVVELRRGDHQAQRLAMERAQVDAALEAEDEKTELAHKAWALQPGNLAWLNDFEARQKDWLEEIRFRMWGPVSEELEHLETPAQVAKARAWRAQQAAEKAAASTDPAPDDAKADGGDHVGV